MINPEALPQQTLQSSSGSSSAHATKRSASKKHKIGSNSKHFPYLSSLQNFDGLKQNLKLHELSYKQVISIRTPQSTMTTPRKPKSVKTRTLSSARKDDYISLDPRLIEESLPKKQEKLHFSSEKRTLLLDRYRQDNETKLIQVSPHKIRSIWHQTLTGQSVNEISDTKDMLKSSRKFNSEKKETLLVPETSRARLGTEEGGLEAFQLKEALKTEHSHWEELDKKLSNEEQNNNTAVLKEVQVLGNLLKDFCKIVDNTQRSYKNMESQQKQLYNFVSAFVEEIDELEKVGKEPKIPRLQFCVKSVNSKIEDLCNEEDLLMEQIWHIKQLLNPSTFRDSESNASPVKSIRIRPISAFSASPIIATDRARPSSMIQDGNVSPVPISEENRFSNNPELINQLKVKTEGLKIDVKNLQHESSQFMAVLQSKKRASIRIKHNTVFNFSPQKSEPVGKIPESNGEDLNLSSLQKQGRTKSVSRQSSFKLSMFAESNNGMTTTKAKDITAILVSPLRDKRHVSPEENDIDLSPFDEALEEKKDAWVNTVEMHKDFQMILDEVELRIRKQIEKVKVFQQDIDKEEEEQDHSKHITKQIEECFEAVLNELREQFGDLDPKKGRFLEEVLSNFMALNTVNKSNVLKLKSLKNVMEISIKKLIEINEYRKKFSKPDMLDKIIRQKYEAHARQLKEELKKYGKTLEFIAKQFNLSLNTYCVERLTSLGGQDLQYLRDRYEGIWKTLYSLNKFAKFEEEYNMHSKKAYKVSKLSMDVIDSLKEFFESKDVQIDTKLWKGEEMKEQLRTVNVKVTSLLKELRMLSQVNMLKKCVEKPLLITTKLSKKLNANSTDIEKTLALIQDEIAASYNTLSAHCSEVEKQVNGHINRFLSTRDHLVFPEWRQNYQIIESFKTEVIMLEGKIEKYVQQKYPARVLLVPRPEQRKGGLALLKSEITSVMKTLTVGRILGNDYFFPFFEGIRTYNLTEKLEDLKKTIRDEIEGQKKISLGLEVTCTQSGRVVDDVINMLMDLDWIFREAYELHENVSKEYLTFRDDNLDSINGMEPGIEAGKPKPKRPKLMSMVSFDIDGKYNVVNPNTPDESLQMEVFEEIFNNGVDKKKLVRTMMSMNGDKKDFSSKMRFFIARLKSLFISFTEEKVNLYAGKHILFRQVFDRFQKMCHEELDTLERVQSIVHNVHINHLFYNREIRPLTKLYRCIGVFETWKQKIQSLMIVKDWMANTLRIIKALQGEENTRGGIEKHVAKYMRTQEVVGASIDIIMEIFSLGSILNKKELRMHLGIHLRIEETGMDGFLKDLEREFNNMKRKYQANAHLIEEDTHQLMDTLSYFMQTLIELLSLALHKYRDIFKLTSEGVNQQNGGFLKYVEEIYLLMKELTDTFCDTLNRMTNMTMKPTWIIALLDEFYREIILKDFHIYESIWKHSHDLEEFLREFHEEFIEIEVKQKAQYRKIADSNPRKCDRRVAVATKLEQTMGNLAHSAEVLCRPELRRILLAKLKALKGAKTIYVNFAMIYSMGRNLDERLAPILANRELVGLIDMLTDIEGSMQDMVKHLMNANEECRRLVKDGDLVMSFNLEKVLKGEILAFYQDLRKWLMCLKTNLNEINTFYHEMKKTFRGEILLLRGDWISFIKGWASTFVVDIKKNLKPVNPAYQDTKEKLDVFVEEVQQEVYEMQVTLKEIVSTVQFLNDKFLLEWFFTMAEEGREVDDKLSRDMVKFVNDIRNDHYSQWRALKLELKNFAELTLYCDQCIKYLGNKSVITAIFPKGVRSWDLLNNYYKNIGLQSWSDLFAFAEKELAFDSEDYARKTDFQNKVQTVEGLYLQAERGLKFTLTPKQREFLAVMYEWMKKCM